MNIRKNEKGIARIAIILIATVIIAACGFFIYQDESQKQGIVKNISLVSPSPTPSLVSNSSWETYSNDKYSFSHPASYELIDNAPNLQTFGVRIPPSSDKLFPLLYIFSSLQISSSSLLYCKAEGGTSPCLSDGSEIEDIQIDNKVAKSFYIGATKESADYHIVQIPSLQMEIRMDPKDGRDRIYSQVLSSFRFTE